LPALAAFFGAAFLAVLLALLLRGVARVVRDVTRAKSLGVSALIARSPEAKTAAHGLKPQEIAEMIFAVNDGTMMRGVLRPSGTSNAQQREQQLNVARTLWRLLFTQKKSHANGHR